MTRIEPTDQFFFICLEQNIHKCLVDPAAIEQSVLPRDTIDGSAAIVADVQGTIWPYCEPYRTSHPFALASLARWKPSGDEVFHPQRVTMIVQSYTHDFVSCRYASIPGTVKSHKQIAAEFGRKHLSCIENQP